MIKTLKNFAYGAGATMLVLPFMASAQITEGIAGAGATSALPVNSFTQTIITFTSWLFYIIAFFSVIGFAISGILYLFAAGDDSKVETAKKAMIASITGVVVALIGLMVIFAVTLLLNGNNRF